jgi:DNA (cytosine-5)-methyltransferase 3A
MKPLRVLSLFDGISCGQVALERAGIPVEVYYASEIDKYAIQVTQKNYPNTIQLGDVTKIDFTDFIGKVDLLIGGSPCQSLSITQSKTRQNLDGKSKLFFEYLRAFETIKPKYFLLENVASMTDECKKIITNLIGVEPIFIDSNCFSAQDRPRLYWTNLPVDVSILKESSLSLKDIMEKNVDKKYFYNCDFDYLGDKKVSAILHINGHDILKRVHSPNFKSHTLTTCGGGNTQKKVMDNGRPRKLTPLEYERLQTLPDNYTSCVSNSQRYNTCGNGWTVDVIAHIFKYLK